MWIYTLFVTKSMLSSYCHSTVWSDLFLDADLSFVFTPNSDNVLDVDTNFPYFQAVRDGNLYTPLRNFVLQQFIFSAMDPFKYFPQLKVYGYRDTEKSARPKVIFIDVVASPRWKLKCVHLILPTDAVFRQEFVFGHFHSHKDLYCFERHVTFLGTVKLVLFQDCVNSPIFVPCLTCNEIVISKVKTLSLLGIRLAWDAQNTNLHKYVTLLNIPIQGKCALLQDELANFKKLDFCPVRTIAERHNLTVLQLKSGVLVNDNKSFSYALMKMAAYKDRIRFVFHQVQFRSINFLA